MSISGRPEEASRPPCRWFHAMNHAGRTALAGEGLLGRAAGALLTADAGEAGPVHPALARVSSSVERGTLKLRHTLALLAPPSSAATMPSGRSGSTVGRRPPFRPRRLAAARPAITRCWVKARSYCASAPKMPNSSSPCGVVVSICSIRLRKEIPCRFRSVTMPSKCGREQPRAHASHVAEQGATACRGRRHELRP